MPYINPKDREHLDKFIDELVYEIPVDSNGRIEPGHVNYIITKIILKTLKFEEDNCGYVGYAAYNKFIGVLECAKQELYRRSVSKYEDEKIKENGDVYNV